MSSLLSVSASVLVGLLLSIGSVVATQPRTPSKVGDLVLVVSSPWGPSPREILRRTELNDRYPVSAPLGRFTQLVNDDDVKNLKANGAWFVLDGKKLAELCSL